jgi:hypothetical protein
MVLPFFFPLKLWKSLKVTMLRSNNKFFSAVDDSWGKKERHLSVHAIPYE